MARDSDVDLLAAYFVHELPANDIALKTYDGLLQAGRVDRSRAGRGGRVGGTGGIWSGSRRRRCGYGAGRLGNGGSNLVGGQVHL